MNEQFIAEQEAHHNLKTRHNTSCDTYNGLEIPRIKIELESISKTVQHMFYQSNSDLNKMVCESIDKTLQEDWVKHQVNKEVQKMLNAAIANVANNFALKNAISELIANNITKLISPGSNIT